MPPADGSALLGGGPSGNEQLTAMVAVVLLVLLAVIGITILRIGQLISVHLFVGLLVLGPVAAKLASTGYRFAGYYTSNRAYREKGPPVAVMRLIAPVVVISTLVVFASGLVLMFKGPAGRAQWLLIHKASFIVWLVFTGVHVLGHLLHLPASMSLVRSETRAGARSPGEAGRWLAIVGALVAGLVLAIALIPDFSAWTAHGVFLHHHHD